MKNKTTESWLNFRTPQTLTKKAMKASYWQYINNTLIKSLEERNVKPFWNYIKSENKDFAGIAPLKSNGILHSEASIKANILNKQFQSVFSTSNFVELLLFLFYVSPVGFGEFVNILGACLLSVGLISISTIISWSLRSGANVIDLILDGIDVITRSRQFVCLDGLCWTWVR